MLKISIDYSSKKLALLLVMALFTSCLAYNTYNLFFPISSIAISDDAEHLHVAYMLGQGKRPFIDFMQNHPMLYNHYLWFIYKLYKIHSIRHWDTLARITVFLHFILCIFVISSWASKLINERPQGMVWFGILTLSWATIGLQDGYLHWLWQIRPDFICYAYTLLGLYLIFLYFKKLHRRQIYLLITGGFLIGMGNAILPKGIIIILPIIVIIMLISLLRHDLNMKSYLMDKPVIYSLIAVSLAASISFASGVALDCHLSGISTGNWISGVLLLNSRKHIIYTASEDNPISSIVAAFSLPFPLMVALAAWGIWEVCRCQELNRNNYGTTGIAMFSVMTIIVNLLMPSFSNGATWSYYFIPSLFAAALIYLLLFNKIWKNMFITDHTNNKKLYITAIIVIISTYTLLPQTIDAYLNYISRTSSYNELKSLDKKDYLKEDTLPSSFIYLSIAPFHVPIRGKDWSYYYMLVRDKGFWNDCFRLGLGPEPRQVWGKGFGDHPPDALAFCSPTELLEFVLAMSRCQGIDVSWLFDEVKKNYVFMTTRGASLYVRRNKVSFLSQRGWQASTTAKTFPSP